MSARRTTRGEETAPPASGGTPPVLHLRLRRPLDRFDLQVDLPAAVGGEVRVLGVFGASGSGKTTLLRAVAGLDRQAEGVVRLGEEAWLDTAARVRLPPERRDVGYVPQEGLLFPHRDVRANLLAGAGRARRRGLDPEAVLERVCRLLELTPLLARRPDTLSGGERQRVALGRALASGPRLLLLDEPLAGLDLPLRRRVLPLLARVRRDFDVPMLLVSHDPTEVRALCDRVVVLDGGRIVADGPPHRLLADPAIVSLAGEEEVENLLPGIVEAHEGDMSRIRLGEVETGPPAPRLLTPRAAGEPGEPVLVGIPAHEVLVATEAPRGLSARNVLPARVTGVTPAGKLHLLQATLYPNLPDVAAQVSRRTLDELALEPGRQIHLVIKAASCRVYEEHAPPRPGARAAE